MSTTICPLQVGDIVECIQQVNFCDNTKHIIGSKHQIKEETVAYYNTPCNRVCYKLIGQCF